jgi:asparagine synthase (glutamine-hydrolysing)
VAGFLRRMQLPAAAREAYAWSQSLSVPIYPIVWRALRMSLSTWIPNADLSPVAWQRTAVANSLSPRLRQVGAEPADCARELNWREAAPDRRRRFHAMAGVLASRRFQTPEPLQHVSYAHPFTDRRLIEFMLTIPPAVVCRPGEPRRLMRRAFAELLPEPVLRRKSKASFAGMYDRWLAPLAAGMLREPERLQVVERGYIERESLLERLDAFQRGADCNLEQLRMVILFEFWLRGLSGTGDIGRAS